MMTGTMAADLTATPSPVLEFDLFVFVPLEVALEEAANRLLERAGFFVDGQPMPTQAILDPEEPIEVALDRFATTADRVGQSIFEGMEIDFLPPHQLRQIGDRLPTSAWPV